MKFERLDSEVFETDVPKPTPENGEESAKAAAAAADVSEKTHPYADEEEEGEKSQAAGWRTVVPGLKYEDDGTFIIFFSYF